MANQLELVQNEEGEVLLQRTDPADGTTVPLVSLRFSPEVRALLGEHLGEIALAMIGAGMQATSQLTGTATAEEEGEAPRVLH